MNNSKLVHDFAHQVHTSGKGSNLFYEGPTLYSYGHHFPICHLATGKTGEPVLFWHDRGYSKTTSKHQALASRATRHIVRIDIPTNCMDKVIYRSEGSEFLGLANIWKGESQRLIKELGTTGKAYAKRLDAYQELRSIETNVLRFIRDFLGADFSRPSKNFGFFSVVREVLDMHMNSEQYKADLAARERRQESAQNAAYARRENQARKWRNFFQSTPEEIAEWIAGTRASVRPGECDILRVVRTNGKGWENARTANPGEDFNFVETSQNVRMTIQEAKAIYLQLVRQELKPGTKVLQPGYPVISVNGVVKIGCHTFETDYLLTFGKTL